MEVMIYPNIPQAKKEINIIKIFSFIEIGAISPKPTVLIVIKIKYKDWMYLS